MSESVSRVEFDCAFEFYFPSGPIPIFEGAYLGGRDMRIAYGVIECQGFGRGRAREGNADFRVQAVIASDITLRQASVGECIGGVFLDCLAKILTGRFPSIARPTLHVCAAAHIEEIGFGIDWTCGR